MPSTLTKSRRSFTSEELAYLREHYPTQGLKRVAQTLNRHTGSVEKVARKLGLRTIRFGPLTEDQLAFLRQHYPAHGAQYCSKHIGRSIHAIRKAVRQQGLHLRVAAIKREEAFDMGQFIQITNPKVAYILGLIWADGHVNPGRTSLQLKLADWQCVEPIITSLGRFSVSIRPPRIRCSAAGSCYTGHKGLTTWLITHDYRIKSTVAPTKILSAIPEHLRHYWWRGYWDGDGYIKATEIGRYSMVAAGTFEQDWTEMEALLNQLEIRYVIHRKVQLNHGSGNINRYSVVIIANREGFQKLGHYLYPNLSDNLGLPRKRQAYLRGLEIAERQQLRLLSRSQPIRAYKLDGTFVADYPSISAAAKSLTLKSKLIREYFQFARKRCKGYLFERLPRPAPPNDKTPHTVD